MSDLGCYSFSLPLDVCQRGLQAVFRNSRKAGQVLDLSSATGAGAQRGRG